MPGLLTQTRQSSSNRIKIIRPENPYAGANRTGSMGKKAFSFTLSRLARIPIPVRI